MRLLKFPKEQKLFGAKQINFSEQKLKKYQV